MSSMTKLRTVGIGVLVVAFGMLGAGAPAVADSGGALPDELASITAVSSTGEETLPDFSRSAEGSPDGFEGTGDLADAGTELDFAVPQTVADPTLDPDYVDPSASRSVIGPDGRVQVAPTGMNAKGTYLEVMNANSAIVSVCTGFLVASNYLLTAGHCVHPGGTGSTASFYPYIDVFPAYGGGSGLRCYNVASYTSSGWINSSLWEGDWGIIKLSCSAGSTYGYFGLNTTSASPGSTVTIFGYPTDKPHGTVWQGSQIISTVKPGLLGHIVDTATGQSGSPMLITSTAVVGIHTQGLQAVYPGENLGVRITAGLKSTINGIIF